MRLFSRSLNLPCTSKSLSFTGDAVLEEIMEAEVKIKSVPFKKSSKDMYSIPIAPLGSGILVVALCQLPKGNATPVVEKPLTAKAVASQEPAAINCLCHLKPGFSESKEFFAKVKICSASASNV